MSINNGTHVWIKQGVMGHMSNPMRKGFGRVAHKCYWNKGKDIYITSIGESNHDPGSLHYDENAVDIKRNGAHIKDIKEALGPDFDVIEYYDMDIFHMEHDPK